MTMSKRHARGALPRPPVWTTYLSMIRQGVLLGFLMALAFSFSSSQAQSFSALAQPCQPNEPGCLLSGGFSGVSTTDPDPISGLWITAPQAFPFGGLVYTDFILVEQAARAKLKCGLQVRENISPYKGKQVFEDFMASIGSETDFNQVYPGPTCYGVGKTFLQVVNLAATNLADARNLYAFMAVFAPEDKFRADPVYISTGSPTLCAVTDKENPNPPDPNFTGLVLEPVVDWCNFRARLRQSVREAANMHMIIGQQFMVKALGMAFSSNITGGEAYVQLEVAQLRAARYQFERAEQFIPSGLKVAAGNGCLVSDFYTQPEWSLLSRAVDQQSVAQYGVASRLSYLGISSPAGVAAAKTTAKTTYQGAAADVYLKLTGTAALLRQDYGRCTIGEHPDGAGVATMALNLIDAQRQAADMAAGRNIFGFDTTFTPARAYKSSSALNCETNAGDRGLWDQAWCTAQIALEMQTRLEGLERDFDNSQTALRTAVNDIRLGLDLKMDDTVGCNRDDPKLNTDAKFFACVDEQIKLGEECVKLADDPAKNTGDRTKDWEPCINNDALNKDNDAATALFELRSAYVEWDSIIKSMENIDKRVQQSKDGAKSVKSALIFSGIADTAARVTSGLLDGAACVDFDSPQAIAGSGVVCGNTAAANTLAQGAAGTASGIADIVALDAETDKEVLNLTLDQSELKIAADAAQQAFFSKRSDVTGMYTALARDLDETKRQRAYFATSPANDPAFRIVRDSQRLQLADAMQQASQLAYLAARRAEYEYAAVLAASNFRISDIYRARIPQDIVAFLTKLQNVTGNLAGATSIESTPVNVTISVVYDVLKLTDSQLITGTIDTPAEIAAERTKRFQAWLAKHTKPNTFEAPKDNKPVLSFSFETSLLTNGLFAQKLPQGYDRVWRLLVGGINSPIPTSANQVGSTGVSVNLVTPETGNLSYRKVAITQGGLVHLRSNAGCVFDYKLIAPAALLGQEWAENQSAEEATAFFNANVNETNPYATNGFRTPRFEGRAISSTKWQVDLFAAAPQAGLPDLDLQQLTDIEILVSATYSSRQAGPAPSLAACTRIDF